MLFRHLEDLSQRSVHSQAIECLDLKVVGQMRAQHEYPADRESLGSHDHADHHDVWDSQATLKCRMLGIPLSNVPK